MTSQEAFEIQSKTIEKYKSEKPELLEHKDRRSESEVFDSIGILNIPPSRQRAYIRLYPQDFIVEEVNKEGSVIPIREEHPEAGEESNTVYAKMIKVGIPTNVAVERIANALGANYSKIGFSGLKDAGAITSQTLAFPNLELKTTDITNLNSRLANIHLCDTRYGSGSLNAGDLYGNKFTLTIRTDGNVEDAALHARVDTISKHGILNYFHTQRFGGLRLLSHKFGMLLLRGELETLLRFFLFKTVKDDIPLVANMRKEAEKLFPDYKGIREIFSPLPYTFYNEIRLLEALEASGGDLMAGFTAIQDQTQLWAYAYASWLFNEFISDHARTKGLVDEEFPLLLTAKPQEFKIYHKYLVRDKTENFVKNLKAFPFIPIKSRRLAGRIVPEDINYRKVENGVVLQFILPKGAYATTFLINLFELHQGLPIPEWVGTDPVDPLALFNNGNMDWIKSLFKEYDFDFKAELAKGS